jgi:hypothetical protein
LASRCAGTTCGISRCRSGSSRVLDQGGDDLRRPRLGFGPGGDVALQPCKLVIIRTPLACFAGPSMILSSGCVLWTTFTKNWPRAITSSSMIGMLPFYASGMCLPASCQVPPMASGFLIALAG